MKVSKEFKVVDGNRDDIVKNYKRKFPLIATKRFFEFIISPGKSIRYIKEKRLLKKSGLFDERYYLQKNPDLYATTVNLLRHWLVIGSHEGRSPGPYFDTSFYLESNPDVRSTGVNPVIHYILKGKKEGRAPLPVNSESDKSINNIIQEIIEDDIRQNKENYSKPLPKITDEADLIRSSGYFDTHYYLEKFPYVKKEGLDPIIHYCVFGWRFDCSVSNKYDFAKYRDIYSDVKKTCINPIYHYLIIGKSEGRKLFFKEYSFPVKYKETSGNIEEIKVDSILDYRRYRINRGKAEKVLYTFDIKDDNWLFEFGINNEWDYVCFVDSRDKIRIDTIWEYRLSDYFNIENDRSKNYYKYHPHIYLKEYNESIWVDPEIKKCGISSSNINESLNNGIACFCNSLVDKKVYDEDILQKMINELPRGIQLTQSDSRLLIRDNRSKEIEILNNMSWFLYSKYNGIGGYFDNNILISKNILLYGLSDSNEILVSRQSDKTHESKSKKFTSKDIGISALTVDTFSNTSKDLKTKVVVPVFNALDDVKKCLNSIVDSTPNLYRLVIADDCSNDETKAWLEEFSRNKDFVLYLRHEKNKGYTENVNIGVKSVKTDFTVVLNSDTIVSPLWLDKLINCAYSDDQIGIVGPLSNAASWQTVPNVRIVNPLPDGYSVEDINRYLEKQSPQIYPKAGLINGFCFALKEWVFDKIGYFDSESYPKGYGEEDDFCLRAGKAGIQCAIAVDTYVFHAKSKSFGHKQRISLATDSRVVLDEKYGKENLLNITESLKLNPILAYYKEFINKLYINSGITKTMIGEPLRYLSVTKASEISNDLSFAVHLHLYYIDMADYFINYLSRIPFQFDLYISVCNTFEKDILHNKFSSLDNVRNCHVEVVDNRGRDIAPFIVTFGEKLLEYDFALHIHSKNSKHDAERGTKWLNWMMDSLLCSNIYINNVISLFKKEENLGFIAPTTMESVYPHYSWRTNRKKAGEIAKLIGINDSTLDSSLYFPAGSFFWFRPKALEKLLSFPFKIEDFPEEPIPMDGTIAHAIERLFFLVGKDNGYDFNTILPENVIHNRQDHKQNYYKLYTGHKKVYDTIMNAIDKKLPFAFIRYYDGEGAFYKLNSRSYEYKKTRMKYYFGNYQFNEKDIDTITSGITESVKSADFAGIVLPEIFEGVKDFVRRECGGNEEKLFDLRKRYNKAIDSDGVWRILSSYEMVMNNISTSTLLCSKDIHYDLVYSGLIYKILSRLEEISIITSQPVKEHLEKLFDLSVTIIKIPERAFDTDSSRDMEHYPCRYNDIIEKLTTDLTGKVFLVGAGPLGKAYCARIKKSGGIALDIGAVLDSWVNFYSRPEHSLENDCKKIDTRLLLSEVKNPSEIFLKERVNKTLLKKLND